MKLGFNVERVLHVATFLGVLITIWLNATYVTQTQFDHWMQDTYWPKEHSTKEALVTLEKRDLVHDATIQRNYDLDEIREKHLSDLETRVRERERYGKSLGEKPL